MSPGLDSEIRRTTCTRCGFVRFRESSTRREVCSSPGEPAHHIVEPETLDFFVDRFASMRWSILTPERCAHWDGAQLSFTDGVDKSQAPSGDDVEALWLTYYSNIFNPARVKVHAMQAEMPKKYWSNLPEAAVIPTLLQEAPRGSRLW
jgi:DNA polymerase